MNIRVSDPTDIDVAVAIRALGPDDPDHSHICTLAHDRIMELSRTRSEVAIVAAERSRAVSDLFSYLLQVGDIPNRIVALTDHFLIELDLDPKSREQLRSIRALCAVMTERINWGKDLAKATLSKDV